MLTKKIISVALLVVLLFSVSAPATATVKQVEKPISVLYTYVNSASSTLDIYSGGSAEIFSFCQKTPAGKLIYLYAHLQKYDGGYWTTVKSWSTSTSTSAIAIINETYQVSRGTYRVATNYTVYGHDGGSDTGTVYSTIVTY
jgi:hypothetical protein